MQKIVKLAERMGAAEAEVFHSHAETYSFSTLQKELHRKEFDEDAGWALRVIKDKGIGFAFFTREEEARDAVRTALALARYSEKAPYRFPEKQRLPKVNAFDKRIEEINAESGAELALDLARGAGEEAEPSECMLSFSTSIESIANSHGVDSHASSTRVTAFASANKGDRSAHSARGSNRFFETLSLGKEAGSLAKKVEKAEKPAPCKTTVILDARGLSSILGIALASADGDRARRGMTKLEPGVRIASEKFTLSTDRTKGMDAFPFDGEGVPAKKQCVLENGVFKQFFFDMRTAVLAREAGMHAVEGNCRRVGYTSPPSNGLSSLFVSAGDAADLLGESRHALFVQSVIGAHTANTITGDFAVEVDIGFVVENGELKNAVKGALISGNVFEWLSKVSGIEKKGEEYFTLNSPRISVADASVSS